MVKVNDILLEFTIPKVMGILNVTPDSFYSESRISNHDSLKARIDTMVSEGVDIFDIGAYSTRPGADDISIKEELERLLPAIELTKKIAPNIPISVDSFRSIVVREAVDAGAGMINDVSGGNLDKTMFKTVADLQVPYVLTHMRGTPKTMNRYANYKNITAEVIKELGDKNTKLQRLGVKDVLIDPGFGFAKTVEQNFELLNNLEQFKFFKQPILVGLSRKSLIWKTLDTLPNKALNGTTVLNTLALSKGARILRVHDIKEAKEAIKLLIACVLSE